MKITTNCKVTECNTIEPYFEFKGQGTSGYLKYFTFIPQGTEVKITIEWKEKEMK